jgi:hypothetical protein
MPPPGQQPGPQTTPEAFGQFLASLITPQVVAQVTDKVKAALRDVPTKLYEVFRQTPVGPTPQQISLPQALVELTDTLKINNEIKRYEIQVMEKLTTELQENRKFGAKVLKRQKQREIDEDED